MAHNIVKGVLVFSCADIKFLKNMSPKVLNLVQNGIFLYFKPILLTIFVTIANIKI